MAVNECYNPRMKPFVWENRFRLSVVTNKSIRQAFWTVELPTPLVCDVVFRGNLHVLLHGRTSEDDTTNRNGVRGVGNRLKTIKPRGKT
jgi:hypothetical protein